MLKVYLLLFTILTPLFAQESIQVLNPNITVHQAGYFKTDKALTPEQVREVVDITPLQGEAYPLSHSDTVWFVFEVSTQGNEKLYLDSKDIFPGSTYDLFVFNQNQLIKSYKNGHSIPVSSRDVKTQPIRFLLEPNSEKTRYVLKVQSKIFYIPIFAFGTFEELELSWLTLHNIMLISYFIGLAFLVYNMILYFVTRDKSFMYYCIYIFGLLLVCVAGRSYLPFGLSLSPQIKEHLMDASLIMIILGLGLFTKHFLKIENTFATLSKSLCIASLTLVATLLFDFYVHYWIFETFLLPLSFYCIGTVFFTWCVFHAGYRTYRLGNPLGLYFLISSGVGTLFIVVFMLVFYVPGFLPIETWNLTLVNQALMWDVITLSVALAYRIRLLSKEKELAQSALYANARFTAIGETIGNIAHQWRQPLAELGSINNNIAAHLRFKGEISHEKLSEMIHTNENILSHLSKTIEVFQSFFRRNSEGSFELTETIHDTLTLMHSQLHHANITVTQELPLHVMVKGNKDEFLHALFNIIANAKDALREHRKEERTIHISAQLHDEYVAIIIEDNGGGITLENINDIFEPYISTKALHGMGIGLFMTKSLIVNRFGGSIDVENVDGGARFTVRLKTEIVDKKESL